MDENIYTYFTNCLESEFVDKNEWSYGSKDFYGFNHLYFQYFF